MRAGLPFLDIVRPSSDGECPKGTEACSPRTKPENTVCYPREDIKEKCPITQIDIVTQQVRESYKRQGYSIIDLDQDNLLVFSKHEDSLPPTTIVVNSEPSLHNVNA